MLTIFTEKENWSLVIDQGGHATRGIVFDETRKQIIAVESPIMTITQGELIVEHDANEMVHSVFDVMDQLYNKLQENFVNIKQAGIATQRSSFVCWDKQSGEALTPIISWQDRRTVNELTPYMSQQNKIHNITGLYLNPHYGATKIAWCLRETKSPLSNENLAVGPLASFIFFHLLNNQPFVVDPANASRMLLMDYKTMEWSNKMLELFCIPRHLLPSICPTKFSYGDIIYKEHAIPLTICTGDQSAAIFAEGELEDDAVFVNVGTGAFVQQRCNQPPKLKKEKLLASVVYFDGQNSKYVIEGTVNGAGRALEWYANQHGLINYQTDLETAIPASQELPIFINGVSGLGSPFWKEIDSKFIGVGDDIENMLAIMESVVFLLLVNIKVIDRANQPVKKIYIGGGIAQSDSFCKKLASISGIPVIRSQQKEATSCGVFYLMQGKKFEVRRDSDRKIFVSIADNPLKNRFLKWNDEMEKCTK